MKQLLITKMNLGRIIAIRHERVVWKEGQLIIAVVIVKGGLNLAVDNVDLVLHVVHKNR